MPSSREPYWQVKSHDGRLDLTPALRSVEVEDHDRLADKATIVVANTGGFSAEAIQPGLRIVVGLGWRDESAPMFEGKVVRQPTQDSAGTMTLVAYDMSTVMNVRAMRPSYPPGKLKDLLYSVILNYHDLEPGKLEPDPDPEFSQPTVVPPGMTDLQFVQYLAVKYRARAFVEYELNRDQELLSRFHFISEKALAGATPEGHLRCCGGFREMIRFDFRRVTNAARPFRPALVMDPRTGESVPAAPAEPVVEVPASVSAERDSAADRAGVGDRVRGASSAAQAQSQERQAMAREVRAAGLPSAPDMVDVLSRPDPTTVMGLEGEGTVVGNIHLRAKTRINISGIASYAAGAWYLKVARHVVTNGNYQTHITVTR